MIPRRRCFQAANALAGIAPPHPAMGVHLGTARQSCGNVTTDSGGAGKVLPGAGRLRRER